MNFSRSSSYYDTGRSWNKDFRLITTLLLRVGYEEHKCVTNFLIEVLSMSLFYVSPYKVRIRKCDRDCKIDVFMRKKK